MLASARRVDRANDEIVCGASGFGVEHPRREARIRGRGIQNRVAQLTDARVGGGTTGDFRTNPRRVADRYRYARL